MKEKLKKAVRESFAFPETAHKEDFFRQVEGSHVSEKKRNNLPMIFRATAAAAAAAVGIGVWGVLNDNTALNHYDYSTHTVIEAAVTDNSIAPLVTAATENITADSVISQTQTVTETAVTTVLSAETAPAVTTLLTALSESTGPAPTVTTQTNLPEENDERSFYMKKLAAFTSAITILAASGSMSANAVYTPPAIADEDQAVIDYIDNNNIDIDFDCDGEFTPRDAYINYLYVYRDYMFTELQFSDETIEKITLNGDVDRDGNLYRDYKALIKYYLLKYGSQNEDFRVSTYIIGDMVSSDDTEEFFITQMRNYLDTYDLGYRYLVEMVENGEISLDFNDDGTENVLDAYDYHTYVNYRDSDIDYLTRIMNGECAFPLATWMNCYNFDSLRRDGANRAGGSSYGNEYSIRDDYYAVVKYFLYNSELTPEMFTSEYYKAHYQYSDMARYFTDFAVSEGIVPPEESDFNDELFWEYYYEYEVAVYSGDLPVPDMNQDNLLDYTDYFDANIYLEEILKNVPAEDSILPEEVRRNFDECDLNDNGENGDIYDITIIQMYILKSDAVAPEDIDAAYNEYAESLGIKPTAKLMYSSQYELLTAEQTIIAGDANNNGVVEVADAVYILQNIADPGNTAYARSVKGETQANCFDPDGSGVDSQDAQAIQQYKVGMLDSLPV